MLHKLITGFQSEGLRERRAAGFAFIELLMVIALVTILVAVLVPVTVQSRNRARTVACLSNLRQIGDALASYRQDWDDRLPFLTASGFAGSAPSAQWSEGSSATQLREVLAAYLRSGGVYRCWNDLGAPEYGFSLAQGPVYSRAGSSYVPWSTAREGLYGVALNGVKAAALSSSSGQVLARDYGSDWHGYRTRSGLDVQALTVANAAYADGHSAAVTVYAIATGDRRYSCWATSASGKSGSVFVCGGSGDVRTELSGRLTTGTAPLGPAETRLSLSGTVAGGDMVHNVDREFVFGADTGLEAAFRQVVVWADGLAAR